MNAGPNLGRRSRVAISASRAVALGAAMLGLTLGLSGCGSASASSVPFTDASALGYIGLCNRAGHQVTSGSLDAAPFAWRAVSSAPARAPYDDDWRTAILLAYQPRQELSAEEWSGEQLTASSRYSNPKHPMAAATYGDPSLETFVSDFHPVWNGWIELRLYLGTRNAPAYSEHYPVLDIQVNGSTWRAVGGGPVNCRSGSSESIESIVLPRSDTSPSTPRTTRTSRKGHHT